MMAVATQPAFGNINSPRWISGGQGTNAMNSDKLRGIFMPPARKTIQRTASTSSLASASSTSSTSTVTSNGSANGNGVASGIEANGWANSPRKRLQSKEPWRTGNKPDGQAELARPGPNRAGIVNGANGAGALVLPQGQPANQNGLARPNVASQDPERQAVLQLLSLNGTFDRKTIAVPMQPDALRIGRQTNAKTAPTPANAYFDSKVLSRQHAEIWAEPNGKIFIRDVKSSNGTFVNGTRLSPENRESDPHELQVQDHLELGIDILSEDQKTVVHHKVSAKVERAGFVNRSDIYEINAGDVDPSKGGGAPVAYGMPHRGRAGSQQSPLGNRLVPENVRAMQGNGMQRPMIMPALITITTESIVKRLHMELRNARLQHEDLVRTKQFMDALLGKEEVKNLDKIKAPEQAIGQSNGAALSFGSDGGKARLSDPPAPPPSQPLPDKPEVPSLNRGTTERPRFQSTSVSPVLLDGPQQHVQLMEMLANARKEADIHSARVRDLEEMLRKEREARLYAEELLQKLESGHHVTKNGVTGLPPLADMVTGSLELDRAFEPPPDAAAPELSDGRSGGDFAQLISHHNESVVTAFQARIDAMVSDMKGMRGQLEVFRQRAEKAEAERDEERKTLAELVEHINQREADERQRSMARKASRSRARGPRSRSTTSLVNEDARDKTQVEGLSVEQEGVQLMLSRTNTITPTAGAFMRAEPNRRILATLPYASMVGVVLMGMGLMAYMNGWQMQARVDL